QTPPTPPTPPTGTYGYSTAYSPYGYSPTPNRNPYSVPPTYGQAPTGYAYGGYRPTPPPAVHGYPNSAPHVPPYPGAAPYQPPKPAAKPAASKGFVVIMMCITIAASFILGCLGGAMFTNDNTAATLPNLDSGNTVVIQHESKEEEPVITDKGDAAYVTSLVADAVVEVSTETVTNNSIFGQYVTEGAGSGVIISSGKDGSYIITCAHVIEGAKTVRVRLKDGTEYTATSIASDAETDVGIIKLNVSNLPTVTIADFSQVVVGEGVVAIGNPLGELGGSVTNGIVSALERSVIIDGTSYNLLQTNAEINPGNSGGGLFNMEGKLIGIVNAKSAGESIEGIGFAIPIDSAMEIATQLIENGYVTGRVKLGFMLMEITNESGIMQFRQQYGIAINTTGVYIVESESKLFKTGDRLVALDSNTIDSLNDLRGLLQNYEVGETVTITVSRLNANNRAEMIDIDLVLTEKKS
ncbi:MAG: trypsin-like serine protease, partial [Ruminococcaceae bacterium]|nr:trypsin-like serine protease [Oscillospiraceae bacterium]